jgi:hypothetical protein
MTHRSRFKFFGSAALLVLAGLVAEIIFGGTLGQLLALGLIGIGLVLAMSLVFFEVGLSEDRERDREEAEANHERRRPRRLPPRATRPRLERMRGRARRLR